MLRIRLKRFGKIHQPFYRIVVAEHSKPVAGEYIAKIGQYDPKKKALVLDQKQALDWMNKGAKPSNTVAKIFKAQGLKHKSIVIKIYKSKSNAELEKEKQAKEAEKQQEAAKKAAQKAEFEAKVETQKKEAEENKPAETPEQNETKPEDKKDAQPAKTEQKPEAAK
ncbi:MAG: 30S ribosomal protein S16 [Patescibacteria group bacterium]|nr:30S ribosomal protein S16 [Patescibacteria group bacterium]